MAGDETVRLDAASAKLLAMAPGTRIFGRYTLEAVAGRGGMGVVWRARDEELERTVALKFLPETVAADPEALRDLKRETKRCLELTHPHIVRVHDFVQDGTGAAIAMEFVDGESLAKRKAEAAGGCLAAAELAPLVGQLCDALDYAHFKARIVHRDLKPANLLVTREGDLKVTDFGIARSLTETRTRLTGVAGGASGTLPYMSPQQLAGDKPTASDDIYALGATLYDLLAGKPPFFRGDAFTLMKQISERTPAPLAEHRTDVACEGAEIPAVWSAVALACLEKDPARRPRSAGEVAERLGLVMRAGRTMSSPVREAGEPPPIIPGPPPASAASAGPATAVPAGAKPKSKMGLGLGLAALAAIGFGSFYYFGVYRPENDRRQVGDRARAEAARVQGESEQQAATAIAAKIDALTVGAAPALRQETESAVQSYLAIAPPKSRTAIETRWKQQAAAWDAARLAAARGSLLVVTTPPGAAVTVGSMALEKSPVTLKEMKLGKYPIVIRLDGYEEQRLEAEVKENEFTRLEVPPLVRSTGAVQLASAPAGLFFVLTGAETTRRGITPAKLDGLPTGDYVFKVSRPAWPDQEKTVKVGRNQTEIALAEFAAGRLEITSVPAGAEVWEAGRRLGETPLQLGDIIPRSFDLELRLKGHKPASARPDVRSSETKRVAVTLEKITGPEYGQRWTVPELDLELVWLRPGSFTMGAPAEQPLAPVKNANPNDVNAAGAALLGGIINLAQNIKILERADTPATQVTLTRGFWLGKTEVTQGQYEAVIGLNPSQFAKVGKNGPVEFVSWDNAVEFCRRLTQAERAAGRLPEGFAYTLPTEAQWEYACRADTTGLYAGNLDLMGWYVRNGGNTTHPVGQKQANGWLLYDMHGNVGEWCLDTFGPYPGGAVTDYTGPAPGPMRVYRGGNWRADALDCRSTVRGRDRPAVRNNLVGFRLALTGPAGPASTSGGPVTLPGLDGVRFAGFFKGQELTLESAVTVQGYDGTIQMGPQTYPFTARVEAGTLRGTFESKDGKFEFTATLTGASMTLVTGGATFSLERQIGR